MGRSQAYQMESCFPVNWLEEISSAGAECILVRFGGLGLTDLYVTTARKEMDSGQLFK